MSRRARITPVATGDVDEIALYLLNDSVAISDRFVRAVDDAIQRILDSPLIGQPREYAIERLSDLRSWPIPGFRNYLVFYRPSQEGIEVVRVLHGARDIDSILYDD